MKNFLVFAIFMMGNITNGIGANSLFEIVKFASVEKSNNLLKQEDAFTKSWSQFDIDSRMHKQNSTKEELLDFATKQTREWESDEKTKILTILKSIDKEIAKEGYKIEIPNEIYFIKTTAKEEGGAGGYTRANYIVLKDDILSLSYEDLKKLLVHELFHVLTRNSPEFRMKLYAIIGFKLMNELEYPKDLQAYRITNPDAPQTDTYISLEVEGEPTDCMMILYSKEEYTEGEFFKYLNVGFLSLKEDSLKAIEYKDDKPVIYSFEEVTGFFEQVGKNTKYIIHPEEILADNFAFTILKEEGLPNPNIVDEIKKKLRE
jgi:hypothetical protein